MSVINALIMGIIQGLTEFLPISSSGHLVIFGKILKMDLEQSGLFNIVLHIGTLLAIIIVYYKDVWLLIKEGILLIIDLVKYCYIFITNILKSNKKKNVFEVYTERKFVLLVIVASIPTAIIGFALKETIENKLNKSLIGTGIALLITGVILILADKIKVGKKTKENTTFKNAISIGIFQGFATLPGISRSGSTIFAGLLNGLDKQFAIKFSFLISLPAIGGAALLEVLSDPITLSSQYIMPYLVGMISSLIVGFICIKTLLVMLKNNKFHYFSYYCWSIGIIAIIFGIIN